MIIAAEGSVKAITATAEARGIEVAAVIMMRVAPDLRLAGGWALMPKSVAAIGTS